MAKYKTINGDTWDIIAKNIYGKEKYALQLMEANPDLLDNIIFEDGIFLIVPDIDINETSTLPPWKQG